MEQRGVRRVTLIAHDELVGTVVVDRHGELEVEVGPLGAMRSLVAQLAGEHGLVEAQPGVWRAGSADGVQPKRRGILWEDTPAGRS